MLLLSSTTYLSPLWGLGAWGLWRFYTPVAPLGLLEAGAQCAHYNCTFQTGSNGGPFRHSVGGASCPDLLRGNHKAGLSDRIRLD